jgi:hypothetical protein
MSVKSYFGVLLLVGSLFQFMSPANAATVQGQIIFTSSNAPAPFVAVRLNAPGKGPSEFAYSGNDGKYYLRNVPAGQYQLEIWRGGKIILSIPVAVQEPVANLATTRVP